MAVLQQEIPRIGEGRRANRRANLGLSARTIHRLEPIPARNMLFSGIDPFHAYQLAIMMTTHEPLLIG